MHLRHYCFSAAAILFAITVGAADNVALNRPYKLEPAPHYEHCTNHSDATELTDGKHVDGYFWTQPGTVGWSGAGTAVVTLDLAADTPISGLSFSTAAGAAGVDWPQSIAIFTASEDGLFHYAGDLVGLADQAPPKEGYVTHKFKTNSLRTHGKQIAIAVTAEHYIFCDEIEVFKGDDAWLGEPLQGSGERDVRAWVTRLKAFNCLKSRIENDAKAVRAAAADISESAKAEVLAQLDAALAEVKSLSVELPPDFKTILPLNATHARVFDALADVWRANGIDGMEVFPAPAWDPLELCPALPVSGDAPRAIEVRMMLNEYRAAAFNIVACDDTSSVNVTINGLPGGKNPPYIDVREVAWTDTRQGKPVAAALLPVMLEDGGYKVSVQPGLVRQVWLTFNPRDLKPGVYNGSVRVNRRRVPLRLHVYPFTFPERPTLHFGGWDYTNAPSHYQANPANKAALVQHLREHFVDSPWATSVAMPFGKYDDSGAMMAPPDTKNFDQWLKLWPDARRYCVFPSIDDTCGKFRMGTAQFENAVGAWAKFWHDHMLKRGLDPAQLVVLLLDEPREPQHDAIIAAWAQAIRASGSKMRLWEDPIPPDMTKASPLMLDMCDILCPNRPSFLNRDEAYRDVFLSRAGEATELEFYSCSGPMRLLDPYTYCRLQPWDCWRYGATASYFWAFADGGGAFSWNEYAAPGTSYTPLFISPDGVTPGKHMEACREGIEDYEYLVMLRNALAAGAGSPAARARAAQLLAERPALVAAHHKTNRSFAWKPTGLPTAADAARWEILDAIMALTAN